MGPNSPAPSAHPPAFGGHPRAPRSGFTLVELLVALVLLSCGALGVVAAGAMAIRSSAAAESEVAATAAARARVEALAAGACSISRDTAGVDSSGSMREQWTVRISRNATRLVTDSVEYDDRFGRRAVVLHRLATC
jgi:prepilin-type N-terminal cleavage/methylation domain-containing protein